VTKKVKTVPLAEAERQVTVTAERLALLHIAYARAIVDELGEERGKKLVLKAIKSYGRSVGEEARHKVMEQGFEPLPEHYAKAADLPAYGMHEGREKAVVEGENRSRAYGCVMGKLWARLGEAELGRLYCYVDAAKYMAYNPDFKLIHTKALPDGDEYCELCVRSTTEQENPDFADGEADWSYIDS